MADYRNQLAMAMMQGGMGGQPIRTPLQGFGNLAQVLAGGLMMRGAERDAESKRKASFDALATAMTDGTLSMEDLRGLPDQELAMSLLPQAFRQEGPAAPPPSRTRTEGAQEIFEEWSPDTESWSQISASPRWAPQQAPTQEPVRGVVIDGKLVDPITGRLIADYSQGEGTGADDPFAFPGNEERNNARTVYLAGEQVLSQGGTLDPRQQAHYDVARQILERQIPHFDQTTGVTTWEDPPPLPTMPRPSPVTSTGMALNTGGGGAPAAPAPEVQTATTIRTEQTAPPARTPEREKAATFYNKMVGAEEILSTVQDAGTSWWQEARAGVPGVGNALVSPERQQFDQAKMSFLMAVLRRESQAQITQSEIDSYGPMFFPVPGDDPPVIEQKRLARQQAIADMQREAGLGEAPAQSGGGIPAPPPGFELD